MTPPTLPGEVWRDDTDGPVCVTIAGGVPDAWTWAEHRAAWQSPSNDERREQIFKAWAMSLRADAQRAAEQMRERCANILEAAAKVRDAGAEHGRAARNEYLRTVSKAEAVALRHAEVQIRALPIADPSPPPACSAPWS